MAVRVGPALKPDSPSSEISMDGISRDVGSCGSVAVSSVCTAKRSSLTILLERTLVSHRLPACWVVGLMLSSPAGVTCEPNPVVSWSL